MTAEKARLFVAVEVPAAVRDGIDAAAEPLRQRQPQARWVSPRAFHLTVAFVGWVGESELTAVHDACAEAAAQSTPFDLALQGTAGAFGTGVLWAGLEDSQPLDALAAAVRDGLVGRGLTVETRPFHAHVTLARAGRDTRLRPDLANTYQGPQSSWTVERIVLMRSRLRRGGSAYSVAAAWRLDDVLNDS